MGQKQTRQPCPSDICFTPKQRKQTLRCEDDVLGPRSNQHCGKRRARILIVAVEVPWIPALNAGMTLALVIPGFDPGIQGSTGLGACDFASPVDARSPRP